MSSVLSRSVSRWADSATRGVSFLLLMVLPILVPWFAVDRVLLDQEQETVTRQTDALDRHLQLVRFASDPEERFSHAFRQCFRGLERNGFRPSRGGSLPVTFPKSLGVKVVFFSTDGVLHLPPGIRVESRSVLTRLWEELLVESSDSRPKPIYQRIFGKRFTVNTLRSRPAAPYEIGPGNTDGIVIWKRGPGRSGLLAYILRPPDEFENLVEFLRGVGRSGTWILFSPQSHRWMVRGKGKWEDWRKALVSAGRSGLNAFDANGHLCRLFRLPGGTWIMRALPRAGDRYQRFRERVSIMGLVVLLAGWGLWQTGFWSPLQRSPLPVRLSLLFSLALLVPAGLLLAVGVRSFGERATLLEREAHERNLSRLQEMDDAVRWRTERLQNFFRKLRDHPSIQAGKSEASDRLCRRLWDTRRIANLGTRDIENRILSRWPPEDLLAEYAGTISTLAMERFLGIEPPPSRSPLESLSKAVFSSRRLGFGLLQDHPDHLRFLQAGKERNFIFWDIQPPSQKRKAVFFLTGQGRETDKFFFLSGSLASGVYAFDKSLGQWFPAPPAVPGLKKLVSEAIAGNQSVAGHARSKGRSLLVSAFPSGLLQDVAYLTWYDLEPVRKAIGQVRLLFWGGVALALVLSLLVARLTSHALLRPVREITSGIQALEGGNLAFRLPDLGQDEFGRLGKAFNAMLAERQDLDMARVVQQRIIPSRPPDFPGYRIAFRYQSMVEVGGDYLDLLPLPDQRLLLVLGDVTGHGVSAALLTTMAKTVALISARKNDGLPRFLDRMNAMLYSVVKKKKLATMVAGILDGRNHTLTWTSAGHPAPLFCLGGKGPEYVKLINYPIGSRKKAEWKLAVQPLAPGDTVVCYTDGVTEAINDTQKMFGFEGLQETVGKAPAGDPEAIVEACFRRVGEHMAGHPNTDDVTVLAISRSI